MYKKNEKFKNELTDAIKFSKILIKGKFDWVFVDDYRLSYKWEKYVSKFCKKIICVMILQIETFFNIYINTKPDFIKIKNFLVEVKNIINKVVDISLGLTIVDSKLKNLKKLKKKFFSYFYNGGSGDLLIFKKIIKMILKSI